MFESLQVLGQLKTRAKHTLFSIYLLFKEIYLKNNATMVID